MDWIAQHWWEFWLALAMVLAVAELASMDMILTMVAVGAIAAVIPAALGAPLVLQVLVASAVSLGMLLVVRPSFIRKLHHGADLKIGAERLIGRPGVVTHAISAKTNGRINVAGEAWTAAPYDEFSSIPEGAAVEVLRIQGATAYVHQIAELDD